MSVDGRLAQIFFGELGLAVAAGQWPERPPPNTLRGVDFYSSKALVDAILLAVQQFQSAHGYLPSLTVPQTFSEHIFWRKFFAPVRMPSLADKLEAYEYVRARVGDEFVPSVVWTGDDVRSLWSAGLDPGRYVLKANHGWQFNMFVKLPEDLSLKRREIEDNAASWLGSRFGYSWGEWHYCTFNPKLFVERFLNFNGENVPDDFKVFCFAGKAHVIEVDVNRFSGNLRTAFYDSAWNHIPVAYRHDPIERARPGNLEQMIWVAETIAKDFDFIRVDLYSDGNSQTKVGELTLTPGNALSRFSDFRFDRWLGSLFGHEPHATSE